VWFNQVVTKAIRLIRPHKNPDMWLVHNPRLAIEAKITRSLTDMDGSYHIETSE
jgi:hypothetical protein